MAAAFPFSAIVGQEDMKLAILCAAVDPSVGGVLVFGDARGGCNLFPGKSVASGGWCKVWALKSGAPAA